MNIEKKFKVIMQSWDKWGYGMDKYFIAVLETWKQR